MTRRTIQLGLLLGLLLGFLLAAAPASAETPAERLLLRIADANHPERVDALTWWDELSDSQQIQTLRMALASENRDVARIAAVSIGYPYLDAMELRRAMALLHDRPLWYFRKPEALKGLAMCSPQGFGAPDFVPFWRAVVKDDFLQDSEILELSHRCARTRHVEKLVPLLDQGNGIVFSTLLGMVGWLGEYDHADRHRATVARGLLYGLRRLRAERAGLPIPKIGQAPVDVSSPAEGGLPAAYLEIADSSFPGADDRSDDGPFRHVPPILWLRRWTLSLRPAAKDVPFLEKVISQVTGSIRSDPFGPTDLYWAMRALAAMPEQRKRLQAWAQEGKEGDERGLYAAAALAEAGKPETFRTILALVDQKKKTPGALAAIHTLLWRADRAEARRRAVAELAARDPEYLPDRHALTAGERLWDSFGATPDITDEDLAWIEDELWRREVSPLTLMWFHERIRPGRLTAERASALRKRLATMETLDWSQRTLESYDGALAELELLDAQATRALLVQWLETQPTARAEILLRLARLGVTGHEAAMFAAWPDWDETERWVLGRVPGKGVREFLRKHATGDDASLTGSAFQGLLIHHGLPADILELVQGWSGYGDELPADSTTLRAALAALDKGDAVAALLVVAKAAEYGANHLGSVQDERVTVFLRELRDDRALGAYWQATASLARGGDAAARAEYMALLGDDRTWINQSLECDGLGSDRSLTDFFLERFDSNCCLWWISTVLLKQTYPSLPFSDGMGGASAAQARAWIEQFDWKHSRLRDAWVPVRK